MELEHSFRVPAPVDEAFAMLLDIEQVAACMPGATLVSMDGDNEFTGEVLVKVGPMKMSYRGVAKIVSIDREAHRAVVEAKGRETRGTGTAAATVTATLSPDGDATVAKVITDLAVTGRPAQFGRGIMVEVGDRLLAEFAKRLAARMTEARAPEIYDGPPTADTVTAGAVTAGVGAAAAGSGAGAAQAGSAAEVATATPSPVPLPRQSAPTAEGESLNLVRVALVPVLKRLVPVAVGAVIGALVVWLVMR